MTDGAKLSKPFSIDMDNPQANIDRAAGVALPPELLGRSSRTVAAADLARRAAAADDATLIVAERGLSTERVARAIHDGSARARGPFITVDCGAGDAASVTAELFGGATERGLELEAVASTSAIVRAQGGTLFLASAGELPATAQLRLSRLLRDGEMRVGPRAVPLSARIMAGAGVEIDRDVEERRFRPELHRRLQRIRVDVPPLRERGEDLPEIIAALLESSGDGSRGRHTLAPAAMTALSALPWPGNLDELSRMLARLVERVPAATIRQEDVLAELQFAPRRPAPRLTSLREARVAFERDYIASVLESHGWSMSAAARTLGIERANLYRKTRQLGITRVKRTRVS